MKTKTFYSQRDFAQFKADRLKSKLMGVGMFLVMIGLVLWSSYGVVAR